MPPPPRPKTSEQSFFSSSSSTSPMANNTWDLYSLSNQHLPQSQTRPIIRPARVSNRIQYCRIFTGDHCPAGVFPVIRSGTGSSRHLNRSFSTTVASQAGCRSGSQPASRVQQATASAIRRFLRMSQRPAAMSAWPRRSRPSAPPPEAAQNRRATSRRLNNNTVVVRRMRQEPVPDQESETESAGTRPYINLLDNPIGNAESAAEELASEEEEEEDLNLKL